MVGNVEATRNFNVDLVFLILHALSHHTTSLYTKYIKDIM